MTLDFSGKNLRGRNFKGRQDLAGANFSYADIRGANFSNANLKGANFSHAKAGLQRHWAIFLVLVSCFLSGLSGYLWGWNGYLVSLIFSLGNQLGNQILDWIVLIVLIAYFFITIRQGITVGLEVAVVAAGTGAFAFVVAVTVSFIVFIASFPSSLFSLFTTSSPRAAAGAAEVAVSVAAAVAVIVIVAGAAVAAGAFAAAIAFPGALALAFPFAFAAAATGTLFNIYISWRAMKGDEKHSLIRNIAIAFAATGGTSFRSADLTNADFTTATLKSTDFRNAILTNAHWYQAKMLDYVRLV